MSLYDKVLIVDEVLIQEHKVLIDSSTLVLILHLRVQRFDSNKRLIKRLWVTHFGSDLVVNISALLSALLGLRFVVGNHAQCEGHPHPDRTHAECISGPI